MSMSGKLCLIFSAAPTTLLSTPSNQPAYTSLFSWKNRKPRMKLLLSRSSANFIEQPQILRNMAKAIGKKTWVIAEGYIPSYGTGKEPEFASHETACILNASDQDAKIEITIYFTDKDPVGPYRIT